MSTRQKRNSRLGRLAVPGLSLLLTAYFVYHGINGRYGTDALSQLRADARHLEFELVGIRMDRRNLEERVLLLHDGTMEADMLEEQARRTLNLLAPDEVAIFRQPGKTPQLHITN